MNGNNLSSKSSRQKWVLLFVVVLMSFMSCLDASIINVAFPVMTNKLSVSYRMLIIYRIIQGIAAAVYMANNQEI